MGNYIDVDEFEYVILNEDIEVNHKCTDLKNYVNGANQFRQQMKNAIRKQPTADVAEVKHGTWEIKSEIRRYLEEIDEEFYVECPFCHRVYYVPFEFEDEKMLEYAKKNYPYCNCGAKMDGGNTE